MFGGRGAEIVARLPRKFEKALGHLHADGVAAMILWAGMTMTVAKKSGGWIDGAGLEFAPEYVELGLVFHGR